jgi:hypothetical protein
MFSLTPLHPLANYSKVSLAVGRVESTTGRRDFVESDQQN